ncbi:MAG: hypothetical protein C0504_14785 [Candidatus Solibacter sp.]|nr:hypothetical protein [Candidatus Solibacter sp.]
MSIWHGGQTPSLALPPDGSGGTFRAGMGARSMIRLSLGGGVMDLYNCKGNKYLTSLLCCAAVFAGVSAAQVSPNPIPARVLGQLNRPATDAETVNPSGVTPNLLEGRELFGPVAVVLDTSMNPPAVYVSDTKNNRVLGWRNAQEFQHGAQADIVIGQKDFFSSAALTPSSTYYSALILPAAMTIGPGGNLFVYDAGNNRILRFPRPFDEQNAAQKADLIIGQVTRISRNPNQSSNPGVPPTATTLKSSQIQASGQTTFLSSLAFDPEGNLWATDAGNHRVLRFAANDVNGAGNILDNGEIEPQIAANRVLGQLGMGLNVVNQARINSNDVLDRVRLRGPAALAFDTAGNLYLADDLARVLFYRAPHDSDGKPASRILGIRYTALPPVNDVTFGFRETALRSGIFGEGARGVFCIGDVPFVVDTLNSRILRFGTPDTWPAETTEFSPRAKGVIGQEDFNRGRPNRYDHWEPSPASFRNPSSAVFANNEIWVADTDNNRVIAFPNFLEQGDTVPAKKLLGQLAFEFRAPNLIEGKEFSAYSTSGSLPLGPSAVVDRGSDPPRLYVADTGNNRILGWADARKVQAGDFADIQIGQVDFTRALVNSPTSNPDIPTKTGLYLPSVVAVDAEGNLWVADTGNSRVLRFPKPFENMGGERLPDLVIGAESYTAPPTYTPSASTLGNPTGIAFSLSGQLYVSDGLFNRVLRFDPPFSSGMAATVVFGQPDFQTISGGSSPDKLNAPIGLAVDADDRLYVADLNNRRIAAFDRANLETVSGINAGTPIRHGSGRMVPMTVAIDPKTGEIWVADHYTNPTKPNDDFGYIRKFPAYQLWVASGLGTSIYDFRLKRPVNVGFDASGNLLVTESINRLTVHYPQLYTSNWESGFFRLAPGLIAKVRVPGVKLVPEALEAPGGPLPQVLGGLQILVEGIPARIYSLSEDAGMGVAKIQIPSSAPIRGTGEIVVSRPETGEILANQVQPFDRASPAFMVQNPPGGGQVIAFNFDGSKNSATNPAKLGEEIKFKLIGYGELQNPPEDGTAAELPVPLDGTLYIGGSQTCGPIILCEATIVSSTLDPSEPGVWLVKAKPNPVVTGTSANNYSVPIILFYRGLTNTVPPNASVAAFSTTVAIKP